MRNKDVTKQILKRAGNMKTMKASEKGDAIINT